MTGILISKPFLIQPTLSATRETLQVCEKVFPGEHHADNKPNAFRHALWNYLICSKCGKRLKSEEKAILWSKKITDLHEEISPNSKIARAMDLHNNQIGRNLFLKKHNGSENGIKRIQRMLKVAVKISSIEDIKSVKEELVYIED